MGIVICAVVGLVAFVAGVLVGRKNKQGVEKLLAEARAELAKIRGR